MLLIQVNPGLDIMIKYQWLFPATECVHIIGFALTIGTIALVDFGLLGFGFRREATGQLVRSTAPWTLSGLILIIFSGLLLFSTDPDHYYSNRAFQIKVTCLAVAILLNYTIHRKVALSKNDSGAFAHLVGAISLALWISVVFGGLFIGFTT